LRKVKVGRGRTRSMAEQEVEGDLFLEKGTDVMVLSKPDVNILLKGVETGNKEVGLSGVSPVLKALGSPALPSTCPGTNLKLPLVPSRCQGALDLHDLERELRREPECIQTLTRETVEGKNKGTMAFTRYGHHDVNQNPEPVWQGWPPLKTSCIDQCYPGRQYQQYARADHQHPPRFSYQPCYQFTPATFLPSSYHQPQGHTFQGLPLFSSVNLLPPGSPDLASHQPSSHQPSSHQHSSQQQQQQHDYAAPFLSMSAQQRRRLP